MEDKKAEKMFFSIINKTLKDSNIQPIFKDDDYLPYIRFGKQNDYPDVLIDLYKRCSIHSSIIQTKVKMMLGDGFVQDVDTDEEPSSRTQLLIEQPNKYESLNSIFNKMAYDFEIIGLTYMEITFKKNGEPILNHIDASKIRWAKKNDENVTDTFYYCQDWNRYRQGRYTPIQIPIYESGVKKERSLLPIVKYSPSVDYYTYPDYISGIKAIQIDTEIDNFHLNNLENGMFPTIFIGFPSGSDITPEERKIVDDKIKEKFVGTAADTKYFLAFYNQDGANKPEIKVIETSNLDKMFDLVGAMSQRKILISHKVVNENIVGISTPSKLGGSSDVLLNYNLYYNQTIRPEVNTLLEAFNRIAYDFGYNKLNILKSIPLSQEFSENILNQILTKDELRNIIGYEPLTQPVTQEMEFDNYIRLAEIDNTNITTITERDLNSYYIWDSFEKDPCPSCAAFNGQVKKLKNWLEIAIPRTQTNLSFNGFSTNFPHSPYGTFCEENCKCKLRKMNRI